MRTHVDTIEIDIIDRAIQIIVDLQDASTTMLQAELRINQSTAEAVLDGLQDCGIVTGRDAAGRRSLCELWRASPRT